MTRSFSRVLNTFAVHQVLQADAVEVLVDTRAELVPQVVGQARALVLAVMGATAAGGVHVLVDGRNDFRDMDIRRAARRL